MKAPKIEELFNPQVDTWVVAYRHASKYFGKVSELNYEPVTSTSPIRPRFLRPSSNVTLSPVFQLLTPARQVGLDAQGRPATSQVEVRSMGLIPEPFVIMVDFCDYKTPMHFEGADIQRVFSEMTEEDVKVYRSLLEGIIDTIQAQSAISLATPDQVAAVVRGRG